MRLRTSAILIVCLTTACLVAILSLSFRRIMGQSFAALEEEQARQNVLRVRNALDELIARIDFLVLDWASWDDAYSYMEDGNQEFLASNVNEGGMASQGLNLILFLDVEGAPVAGAWYDSEEKRIGPLPQQLEGMLGNASPLLNLASPSEPKKGLVSLPEGTLLTAARPILTSGGQGPPRGTLVMGKLLEAKDLATLRRVVDLDFATLAPDASELPGAAMALFREKGQERGAAVFQVSDGLLRAFIPLYDLTGPLALVLSLDMPRDIHLRGLETMRFVTASLAGSGLVFCLVIIVLFQRRIISRVGRLGREVNAIGHSDDASGRVSITGDDEIAGLGEGINHMLARLEEARDRMLSLVEQLRKSESVLEDKVEERTRELTTLNERLFDLNEMRSTFLSSASHELRTPLTSVLGFAMIMEKTFRRYFLPLAESDPELARRAAEFCDNFQIIRTEGRRLNVLINDLLDLNSIEAQRMVWKDVVFDPAPVLLQAADEARRRIPEGSGLIMVADLPPCLPPVMADPARMRQVLDNLLDNALKFTRTGRVELSALALERGIRITVRDTGVGIPASELDRVFDKFYQTRRTRTDTDKPVGSGLGLALCRHIVEHYGGEILAVSEVGKGSEFAALWPVYVPS